MRSSDSPPPLSPRSTIGRRAVVDLSISRVLVVDDDEDMRLLLAAQLEEFGYFVSVVPDGETAIQWLEQNLVDVVILDLLMTGIGGLEVLKHIRERGFDVAVILSTAHSSEEIAIEALRFGADDYLRKPFTRNDLRVVLDRAAQKLSLFRHNVLLRRQLGVELSRAAAIQADLLPSQAPSIDGWDLAALCVPARQVGGDFYDWQHSPRGTLSLTVGDVMGKGIPAALLMASVRAVLRAVGETSSPAVAVQRVASVLASDLSRSGAFVTLFHAQLELATGRLRYVDAGHGYVRLWRAGGQLEKLPATGLPLGVLDDEVYDEGCVTMEPGDVLLIYSDGLTESRPDLFRVAQSGVDVPPWGHGPSTVIAQSLIDGATLAGPLPDDLTVGVLRRLMA